MSRQRLHPSLQEASTDICPHCRGSGRIRSVDSTALHIMRLVEEEIEPFTVEEAQQILRAAASRRNGVRFALALALGLRQGEALGLKWDRLDRKSKALRFPKQIQRHVWQHGCEEPHECGERWHKRKPCPPRCRHKKCPPVCAS